MTRKELNLAVFAGTVEAISELIDKEYGLAE
jgi:hypothetical protein